MRISVQQGRFVSLLDQRSFYCVIGQNIAAQIEKQMLVPSFIGKQLLIGNNYFTIVGELAPAPTSSFIYTDLNNSVFIPIMTSQTVSKYSQINNIVMELQPQANIDQLETKLTTYINQRAINQNIYFNSAKQIIAGMKKQQQILTAFLGFIGGISLFVGGIGVMNIMLVSVTERRREIGVRMAIGAKPHDITMLFLTEAIILSLFGGILGVITGIVVSFIIATAKHWGFEIFGLPPTIGFCVSVFIGIFFGFYPAYKASKLDPIETLRSE
jgi:putative ABC transport system permease protein